MHCHSSLLIECGVLVIQYRRGSGGEILCHGDRATADHIKLSLNESKPLESEGH